jgi:hypothetical protein
MLHMDTSKKKKKTQHEAEGVYHWSWICVEKVYKYLYKQQHLC